MKVEVREMTVKRVEITSECVPRVPTPDEHGELVQAYSDEFGVSNDELENPVYSSYIAVFDKYSTGGPGWCGKLAVIVFDGSPGNVQTWGMNPKDLIWEKFGEDYD